MRREEAVVAMLRRTAAADRGAALAPEAESRALAASLRAMAPDGDDAGTLGLWRSVLGAQVRLFPPAVRLAALVVLVLGVALALLAPGTAAVALDLAAPALAAVGVLLAFGGARRESLEVELACAVRPYELLLARLILVVGADLALALAATLALLPHGGAGAALHLVLTWFAPLLLLAGLNLALSMRWGAIAAAVPSAGLWGIVVAASSSRLRPRGWRWLVPAHMPAGELAACAVVGCLLLAWAVLRGRGWVGAGGEAA